MTKSLFTLAAAVAACAVVPAALTPPNPPAPLTLSALGSLKTGPFRTEDPRVAEINAYDEESQRLFVVNPLDSRLDVIDVRVPSVPTPAAPVLLVDDCEAALGAGCPLVDGGEPNSVAIRGGIMAVAYANAVRTDNGHVIFYKLRPSQAPQFDSVVEVGALPDMVTFSDNGRQVLVANEGEPSQDYSIDPPGSVSIIDIGPLGRGRTVRRVGFEAYDSPEARAALEAQGVRIFGPGAQVSQDLEPEYIAVQRGKAYVTLQENNALGIIDIRTGTVDRIVGLGRKDHSLPGNALDPSDRDSAVNGGINIANWPVHGMYQPDAIAAFTSRGRTYLITANEGDARAYAGYEEEARVGSSGYVLDPTVFPNAAALKSNAALGRLTVSTATGDTDGDGDFDRIDVFGGRSVSIRDAQGALVWDSGDLFERLSASLDGTRTLFNTTSTANARDNRSDDKGIEPESVVVGEVNGRPYAFVGLERDGGLVVLDLSTPSMPTMVTYVNRRLFPRDAAGAYLACSDTVDCGDLGPEGLTFVPARQSPTGKALLVVSNEVSSTTSIWEVQ
jgi:hypothetical protein